jgi:hypothetical protein
MSRFEGLKCNPKEGVVMKGGAQAAVALGVGYVLGRRRKMRLATMLALGAATGGIGGLGPAALRRGAKYLGSTDIAGALGPQVGEIVSTIRGDLLDASKAAAATAVSSRIESLSDNLHERAETLRNPEAAAAGAGAAAGRAGRETAGRAGEQTVGRLRRRDRGADVEDEAERDEEERSNGRTGRARPRRRSRSEADEGREPEDEYQEYDDEEPDEDELDEPRAGETDDLGEEEAEAEAEEPAPRRRRASRSPVARTRR